MSGSLELGLGECGCPSWGLHFGAEILVPADSVLGHTLCISWVVLTKGEKLWGGSHPFSLF